MRKDWPKYLNTSRKKEGFWFSINNVKTIEIFTFWSKFTNDRKRENHSWFFFVSDCLLLGIGKIKFDFRISNLKSFNKNRCFILRPRYAYLFLPGEEGCWRRKYVCFSCASCQAGGWRTAVDKMKGTFVCTSTWNNFWGCNNTYCGTWDYFKFHKSFEFQTIHIRDFLRNKVFITSKQKLRLKDVNGYLKEKLKLKKNPAKGRHDVVDVWEKLFPKLLKVVRDWITF